MQVQERRSKRAVPVQPDSFLQSVYKKPRTEHVAGKPSKFMKSKVMMERFWNKRRIEYSLEHKLLNKQKLKSHGIMIDFNNEEKIMTDFHLMVYKLQTRFFPYSRIITSTQQFITFNSRIYPKHPSTSFMFEIFCVDPEELRNKSFWLRSWAIYRLRTDKNADDIQQDALIGFEKIAFLREAILDRIIQTKVTTFGAWEEWLSSNLKSIQSFVLTHSETAVKPLQELVVSAKDAPIDTWAYTNMSWNALLNKGGSMSQPLKQTLIELIHNIEGDMVADSKEDILYLPNMLMRSVLHNKFATITRSFKSVVRSYGYRFPKYAEKTITWQLRVSANVDTNRLIEKLFEKKKG